MADRRWRCLGSRRLGTLSKLDRQAFERGGLGQLSGVQGCPQVIGLAVDGQFDAGKKAGHGIQRIGPDVQRLQFRCESGTTDQQRQAHQEGVDELETRIVAGTGQIALGRPRRRGRYSIQRRISLKTFDNLPPRPGARQGPEPDMPYPFLPFPSRWRRGNAKAKPALSQNAYPALNRLQCETIMSGLTC